MKKMLTLCLSFGVATGVLTGCGEKEVTYTQEQVGKMIEEAVEEAVEKTRAEEILKAREEQEKALNDYINQQEESKFRFPRNDIFLNNPDWERFDYDGYINTTTEKGTVWESLVSLYENREWFRENNHHHNTVIWRNVYRSFAWRDSDLNGDNFNVTPWKRDGKGGKIYYWPNWFNPRYVFGNLNWEILPGDDIDELNEYLLLRYIMCAYQTEFVREGYGYVSNYWTPFYAPPGYEPRTCNYIVSEDVKIEPWYNWIKENRLEAK